VRIRQDFVTNSSSSSFIVLKKDLTDKQIEQMRNLNEEAKRLNLDLFEESYDWSITETDKLFKGWTFLNNFMIEDFFEAIGVDMDKVNMNGGHFSSDEEAYEGM
jgi:hypothetical protein